MDLWVIDGPGGTRYAYPFDPTVLPAGPLLHALVGSPRMYRVYTDRESADRFVDYTARAYGDRCAIRPSSARDLVPELTCLGAAEDPPVGWVCLDEQPWLTPDRVERFGRPLRIAELVAWA